MMKTKFSGRQIAYEKAGASILYNNTKRNIAILVVENSSSKQSKNRGKSFIVLGITPGKVRDNKGEPGKNNYHYNNSDLNVNGEEIVMFTAKQNISEDDLNLCMPAILVFMMEF